MFKNNAPFVRVSFSERENFINNLVNTSQYKNKISFVEGFEDIPNEIWTNGKKYSVASDNQLTRDEIIEIIRNVLDENNDGIPDIYEWEEYTGENDNESAWAEY